MITDKDFAIMPVRHDSSYFELSRKPSMVFLDKQMETDSAFFSPGEAKDVFDKSVSQDLEIYEEYLEELRQIERKKILDQIEQEKENHKPEVVEKADKNVATTYQMMISQETFTNDIQKSEKLIGTEPLQMTSQITETIFTQHIEMGTNTETPIYNESENTTKYKKSQSINYNKSIENSQLENESIKNSNASFPIQKPDFQKYIQSETTSVKGTSKKRKLRTLQNLDEEEKQNTPAKSIKNPKKSMTG